MLSTTPHTPHIIYKKATWDKNPSTLWEVVLKHFLLAAFTLYHFDHTMTVE